MLAFWAVFFVVSNIVGVQVFKAALTLPHSEAGLPALLCVPLIGLCAFTAGRFLAAWDDDSSEEEF